jgi:hypothetical protein
MVENIWQVGILFIDGNWLLAAFRIRVRLLVLHQLPVRCDLKHICLTDAVWHLSRSVRHECDPIRGSLEPESFWFVA